MELKGKKREVIAAVVIALVKASADMSDIGLGEAMDAAEQALKNNPHIQMHPRDLAQKIVNFGRLI